MTPPSFHHLVDEYLNARRGLGFDLETDEWFLRAFVSHADRAGHSGSVTIELAVQWARSSSRSSNPVINDNSRAMRVERAAARPVLELRDLHLHQDPHKDRVPRPRHTDGCREFVIMTSSAL